MSNMAKELMTKEVIIVPEDMMISELNELFLEHNISGAPVVDKDDKLTGIVTKTDILSSFLDAHIDLKMNISLKDFLDFHQENSKIEISSGKDLKVVDIMTKDPITANENTPVEEMADKMIINNIHRLIISKGSEIAGIITTIDLLYGIAKRNKNE